MIKNKINICICTYKRPSLLDTLNSIVNIKTPDGYTFSIIVCDNDIDKYAEQAVNDFKNNNNLDVTYINYPDKNISIARNGCLENLDGDYCIFIDDDETVSENWLCELLLKQQATNADIVLGPVIAIYPPYVPKYLVESDIYSTYPVYKDGSIITGYSCNVLIRINEIINNIKFDVNFGKTGGEDTLYFGQLYKLGCKIEYCNSAIVSEIVTKERANLKWLIKRKFRMGQTHILMSYKDSLSFKFISIINAISKIFVFIVLLPFNLFSKSKLIKLFLRIILQLGIINKLIGGKVKILY